MGSDVRSALEELYRADRPSGVAGVFGSQRESTGLVRRALVELFSDLDVRSLVDAGCGRADWIVDVVRPLDSYLGVDVVSDLVGENRRQHHLPFRTADIRRDALPATDAILCRDCLGQLPLSDARLALGNLVRAGSRYLVATTFPAVASNIETRVGATRPLNLTLPPFDLPPPDRLLCERGDDPDDELLDKSLGVWETSTLTHIYGEPRTVPRAHLFIHVPKTSGTAFRIALERFLGSKRVAYDYAEEPVTHALVRQHRYDRKDLSALGRGLDEHGIAVLGGHVHYQHYSPLFTAENVITFLRDPIARIVSEYFHFRRHNGFAGSLLEFAELERNQNLQSAMLEGAPLDQIACFGVSERYEDSLRLFEHRLGWRLQSLQLNVNPDRTRLSGEYDIDSATRRKLESWNEKDLAHYHEARLKLDEAFSAP